MDILEYIKTTSFARPSEKPQSTVQPSPTLEKRDDITPIESHLIPMSHPVARPTQVTSLSSHSSIPGPTSLLPNSPTKDIAYEAEKLVKKIELMKVYDAMKKNKLNARKCPHLQKILEENTAGFNQKEYLHAYLLSHDDSYGVKPLNLFFKMMQENENLKLATRDIWLDWLSQPTDPVYKSLLSQVIRITDPRSKESLLEWSVNTDSTKAHDIKAWIKKVLPDETFENLPKESEIASSMTSVPHHPINPRKRRRNRHQIGLPDEQKKRQKKPMPSAALPAFLPEDCKWSPSHGHQPAQETPELLPQNPEDPGSSTTSFTSEKIDNALNFISFSQTSPVTQVSQSVTEPAVLADTETNSQEIKPAQTLFARPSEKPKGTVQPSPTLEKRDDITPIESRLIPMRHPVAPPAQVTSLSSHSSIPGPTSLLPNSPTKDIAYGTEILMKKVYEAMKKNKLYAIKCPCHHLKKILQENTAGFSQEEYLKALLGHDIPDVVMRPFNLFFRSMWTNYDFSVTSRNLWLDWLSQPTDPVYKSLLSKVIRIKDPTSRKSVLEWSGNTNSTKARAIKVWIKKVLPDETFGNLSKKSEIAASMTSVPHHQINPRKRRRNRHQIGLPDEQKKHQKKSMLPVTLPAFLPEDYKWLPPHGHQPAKETPELLPQNPENPGSATTSFTSEKIDNILNSIPFSQTSPVTQVSQSVTEPLEKHDDITPIESRLIPMRHPVAPPAQVTSLSSHSSIPGPASLLPNSPTKDIAYGTEKLVDKIELLGKVYDAMKRNKIYAKDCPYWHLEKILKENTAGFSQEEYLKALLGHDIPDVVMRPFNLFFRLMWANFNMSLSDIWLDWLSQPTDPVYKSLLSKVIRIKDPTSRKSVLEWSGNTDSTKARAIKVWIKKVLPDETFGNLSKKSEIASSMTSVPHHPINPRKRPRNRHQIGLPDEQKKHQKKSMLPVALPAFLPTEPAIPVICITGFEEDRHSQVFPDIPAGHSVHDFLTVADAKTLPITLNDPHSGTGMGTRLPPYSLWQWQQNLIKVRQLSDGKIMTAAQNCTKVVDKLIEGSYSGVFTQADPAPASGLEYSSDIKIIYLNNNEYAALDGSTLTLTEQGINKYMQIPVVKKEGSVPCFNANFEEDKFKGTYIEVKQLKPTMQTLARQYGGWVLAVAALSPLVKLTGKKRTATLSDFKNYGHVCLIQYDGASLIIIDPQLTRQEDINECVKSDINNIYRFFDPKSPAKSAEFNNHITLTVVNSSVDMRRKSKTESLSDGGSTQASASTSLGPSL